MNYLHKGAGYNVLIERHNSAEGADGMQRGPPDERQGYSRLFQTVADSDQGYQQEKENLDSCAYRADLQTFFHNNSSLDLNNVGIQVTFLMMLPLQ